MDWGSRFHIIWAFLVEAIGEGVKNLSLSKEPLLRVLDQGANLAFTQRVRIEYALNGGRINIETAAGVDLSDRGVNLKILRGRLQNADCPCLLRRALNHAS